MSKGHILVDSDLIAKRPNIGDYLAEDLSKLVGKSLTRDLKKDSKLFKTDLI